MFRRFLLLVLILGTLLPMPTTAQARATGPARQLFQLTNELRRDHGLAPMEWDARMVKGATRHSEQMRARQDLFHSTDLGGWINATIGTGNWNGAGENIGEVFPRPNGSIYGLYTAFIESPGHRANILTPGYRLTAIGTAKAQSGKLYVTVWFVDPR